MRICVEIRLGSQIKTSVIFLCALNYHFLDACNCYSSSQVVNLNFFQNESCRPAAISELSTWFPPVSKVKFIISKRWESWLLNFTGGDRGRWTPILLHLYGGRHHQVPWMWPWPLLQSLLEVCVKFCCKKYHQLFIITELTNEGYWFLLYSVLLLGKAMLTFKWKIMWRLSIPSPRSGRSHVTS